MVASLTSARTVYAQDRIIGGDVEQICSFTINAAHPDPDEDPIVVPVSFIRTSSNKDGPIIALMGDTSKFAGDSSFSLVAIGHYTDAGFSSKNSDGELNMNYNSSTQKEHISFKGSHEGEDQSFEGEGTCQRVELYYPADVGSGKKGTNL